ncbi:hypothetical protein ACLI4U_15840 [Natrialbaceae archaeon A-CW2]
MRTTKIGAVLVALLVVASMGVAAFGAGPSTFESTQEEVAPGDVDQADEVYVYESGDAVLVYEEDHSDDPDAQALAGSFGLETQTGLMHALYTADFSEMDEDGAEELGMTGDMSMHMTPDVVASSADLTFYDMEDSEDLETFDFSADIEQTSSSASSNIDFTFVESTDNWVEQEQSVDLEATTETAATTFSSSGTMTAETGNEMAAQEFGGMELRLTQDGDSYDLEVSEERTVYQPQAWESEEAAKQSLEDQYRQQAIMLGGQVDVTLESHSFDDSGQMPTVDLEYTVRFDGIQTQVQEMIAAELQNDPELDLDQNEAQALADRLASLEIDEVYLSAEASGTQVNAEWNVEFSNYDEVVLGVVEIADSLDDVDDELADQFDEMQAVIEAQQAADLVQTTEMSLYAGERPDETFVEFSASMDTQNWGTYVSELEDRGVEQFAAETQFTMDAELVGDELQLTYDFESSEEAMLEQALAELETAIENDPYADDEMLTAIENFREADFEIAAMSMSATDEEMEFEAAMSFDDMTALDGVPFETDDGETITGIHAETEDGVTTFYITLEDYVGENADEAEVREKDQVGPDTEVHLPGEWDRDFPSIDEEAVQSYLEQVQDSESSSGIDTTTVLVGVAIVGGLFIAYRKFS